MTMFSTKFLPKFFKEVMTHIPTLALKSMDWTGLAKEIAPMTVRLGRRHLDDSSFESLRALEVKGVDLIKETLASNYSELDSGQRREAGETVLRLYFAQLSNSDGLCLDLRPKHFEFEGRTLHFSPNNVWFSFNESFRLALIDLYKGFYHQQEELFDKALARIGLTKNLEDSESERLKNLFREHFGPGNQEMVKFEMTHFQDSFYELFRFFMDHQVALDKDFMFLGVYLVGLYLNLEALGEPVNVRRAFLEVFPAS